jgi:hypothetical protein
MPQKKAQTYLQRLADGRDRDIEYVLAESWSSAAFLISRVNKELSVRLVAKVSSGVIVTLGIMN